MMYHTFISYRTLLQPLYPDFHACQEARAKLPRGSYEGHKHLPPHQGGPWPGIKQMSACTPRGPCRDQVNVYFHIGDQAKFCFHTKGVMEVARGPVDVRPHSRGDIKHRICVNGLLPSPPLRNSRAPIRMSLLYFAYH